MWYLVQALWRAKETFSASLADIDDFRYPSRAIRGIDRISLCESMARACSTVGAAINPSQLQTDPLPNGSGDGQGRARDIHFPRHGAEVDRPARCVVRHRQRVHRWSAQGSSRRLRPLVTIEPYWRPFSTQTPVRRRFETLLRTGPAASVSRADRRSKRFRRCRRHRRRNPREE